MFDTIYCNLHKHTGVQGLNLTNSFFSYLKGVMFSYGLLMGLFVVVVKTLTLCCILATF